MNQEHALVGSAQATRFHMSRFLTRLVTLLLISPLATAFAADDAASYLVFESMNDGRCQNLSDGGKLRILRNTHAEWAIHFRLTRMFAGNRPQGLVQGLAPAGGEPVRLGCTRVDGREQDWVVRNAQFTSPGETP